MSDDYDSPNRYDERVDERRREADAEYARKQEVDLTGKFLDGIGTGDYSRFDQEIASRRPLAPSMFDVPPGAGSAWPASSSSFPIPPGSVYRRICHLISRHLGVPEQSLTLGTRLNTDLDAKSYQREAIFQDLESAYGVEFTDQEKESVKTVDDVLTVLVVACRRA
jgi:acyl carrier protein